jgi:hypothetical protein
MKKSPSNIISLRKTRFRKTIKNNLRLVIPTFFLVSLFCTVFFFEKPLIGFFKNSIKLENSVDVINKNTLEFDKLIIPNYVVQSTVYFEEPINDLEVTFRILNEYRNLNPFEIRINTFPFRKTVSVFKSDSISYKVISTIDDKVFSKINFVMVGSPNIKFLSGSKLGSGYCDGEFKKGDEKTSDKIDCPKFNHIDEIISKFEHPKDSIIKMRFKREKSNESHGYISSNNEPWKEIGFFKNDDIESYNKFITISLYTLKPLSSCDELKPFSMVILSTKNDGNNPISLLSSKDLRFECKDKVKSEVLDKKITFSIQ